MHNYIDIDIRIYAYKLMCIYTKSVPSMMMPGSILGIYMYDYVFELICVSVYRLNLYLNLCGCILICTHMHI